MFICCRLHLIFVKCGNGVAAQRNKMGVDGAIVFGV